jgi:hypothetical protein
VSPVNFEAHFLENAFSTFKHFLIEPVIFVLVAAVVSLTWRSITTNKIYPYFAFKSIIYPVFDPALLFLF